MNPQSSRHQRSRRHSGRKQIMSPNEQKLFSVALKFWFEHRQGGACADVADFDDGCNAIKEETGITPSPDDLIAIRMLVSYMGVEL